MQSSSFSNIFLKFGKAQARSEHFQVIVSRGMILTGQIVAISTT